ncbi:hypothetical protein JW758_05535 [Candidatus Peregrinibacteria bacterium]|nr:hypothetical protein [Candidatus Peregrinibacteria bacterium]
MKEELKRELRSAGIEIGDFGGIFRPIDAWSNIHGRIGQWMITRTNDGKWKAKAITGAGMPKEEAIALDEEWHDFVRIFGFLHNIRAKSVFSGTVDLYVIKPAGLKAFAEAVRRSMVRV